MMTGQIILVIVLMILTWLAIALVAGIYLGQQKRSWALEKQVAPALNFSFEWWFGGDESLRELCLACIPNAKKAIVKNFLTGRVEKVEVALFDVYINLFKSFTILAIHTAGKSNLPLFFVRPPELMDDFKQSMGYRFVELPTPYLVLQLFSNQPQNEQVFQAVDPKIWFTMSREGLIAAHNGQWFIVFWEGAEMVSYEQKAYEQFLQQGLTIFHELNSAAAEFNQVDKKG